MFFKLHTDCSHSVTEQPFKIPYYAALLRLLHDRPVSEEVTTPLGRQVLEDFWKAFREFIDKHAWRETRLCVRLTWFYSFSLSHFPFAGAFLRPLDRRAGNILEVDVRAP